MTQNKSRIIHFPPLRQFTTDVGIISRSKHYIHAFLEVDVTEALQKIKAARSARKKISFIGWFVKVTADTVSAHPPVDGIRKRRYSIEVFEDINISVVVEKTVNGSSVPLPLVVRSANHKTALEITMEIQNAVSEDVSSGESYVLSSDKKPGIMLNLAAAMPQWLRIFFMRAILLRNPQRMHETMGTVTITSLGTVGGLSGWILPTSMHPMAVGIGSLNKKPVILNGEVQKRDILHLTLGMDHDVIDGMPALKFTADLVDKLEKGAGLE